MATGGVWRTAAGRVSPSTACDRALVEVRAVSPVAPSSIEMAADLLVGWGSTTVGGAAGTSTSWRRWGF